MKNGNGKKRRADTTIPVFHGLLTRYGGWIADEVWSARCDLFPFDGLYDSLGTDGTWVISNNRVSEVELDDGAEPFDPEADAKAVFSASKDCALFFGVNANAQVCEAIDDDCVTSLFFAPLIELATAECDLTWRVAIEDESIFGTRLLGCDRSSNEPMFTMRSGIILY